MLWKKNAESWIENNARFIGAIDAMSISPFTVSNSNASETGGAICFLSYSVL